MLQVLFSKAQVEKVNQTVGFLQPTSECSEKIITIFYSLIGLVLC